MVMIVAVAEDEEILANTLQKKFQSEGFEVLVARNGQEVLDLIQKGGQRPHLILLDLIMPIRDGFSVLEEMHRDPDLKNIPVMVLSNLGEDADIKRALSLGAVDYFVKAQHSLAEIVEKVKKFLANHASEVESKETLPALPSTDTKKENQDIKIEMAPAAITHAEPTAGTKIARWSLIVIIIAILATALGVFIRSLL